MYICETPYFVIRKPPPPTHTSVPLCHFVILFTRRCISWEFCGRLQTVEAPCRSPCNQSGFVVDESYAGTWFSLSTFTFLCQLPSHQCFIFIHQLFMERTMDRLATTVPHRGRVTPLKCVKEMNISI